MLARRGFRWRLTVTVVALVALTAVVLGAVAYVLASRSLRDRLISDSTAQASFAISVLATERLSAAPTADEVARSGLVEAIRQRSGAETLVDFGDGDPFASSLAVAGTADRLSADLTRRVAAGELAYQSLSIEGTPYLVVGGRRPGGGADLYLFFPAATVETALAGLGQALTFGALASVVVALLVAGLITRGVLRPVRAASDAAMAIGAGDLSARVPVVSRDEFGRWASAFNAMAASLEHTVADLREAQARQRRFVSDVSHELRTPLTGLVSEAELLRPRLNTLDRDGRRLGELLIADVERLRGLVDELMELSRFDAGAEHLDIREIDLARFLSAVIAQRLPTATLTVPAGLVLLTDQRRLERIVGNLIDNAREHGEGLAVEVSAERTAGGAVVRVADRGPGLPPDQLRRVFERFTKADPSRQRGGSGLGLAIAREHATTLGGSLTAAARPGGGLVFELQLPGRPPSAPEAL